MSDYHSGLALEKTQRAVLDKAYRREGDYLICDPATLDTPLQRVLDHEETVGELIASMDPQAKELLEMSLGRSMNDLCMELRQRTLLTLLDWLAGDRNGPMPRKVLKRFYAFARAISDDHIWRMNQTEIGLLFGETKSAVCEREKQEVEGFMRLWNMKHWQASGGKSGAARDKFSKQKNGNHCRKGGKKVERLFRGRRAEVGGRNGDVPTDLDGLPDGDFVKRPGITRAHLDALAAAAERKRLAGLCGVSPKKINLELSAPPRRENNQPKNRR